MLLDEQLAWFDRRAEQAYIRCLKDMKGQKQAIIAEARRRLIAGYELYGDAMFTRSYEDLRQAQLEEVADMVNYKLGSMRQGWPT